jgi:hypothetical protein
MWLVSLAANEGMKHQTDNVTCLRLLNSADIKDGTL